MAKIAAVLNVRNEEQYIKKSLQSILDQELAPYRIIVVNDGSTDKTKEIVEKFPRVELVNNPARNESYLGRKELAATINQGLVKLHNDTACEFAFLTGGDLVFPKDYLNSIVARMKHDSAVIASGAIEGEFSATPRGEGRIVDWNFWKKLGMLYPVNYGWEGYLVFKAQCMGYHTKYYEDLTIVSQRKTGTLFTSKKYYYYGLAHKALGYAPLYAIIKSLLFGKRKPQAGLAMLRGYFSNYDDLYEKELRDYVRATQSKNQFSIKSAKRFFRILSS